MTNTAIRMIIILTVLTGLIYPLTMTGLAQLLFPTQADGSLIRRNGTVTIGSKLIGQQFDDPKYFWPRLSATATFPYNAASSSGSNLGPKNPALRKAIEDRRQTLLAADPTNQLTPPIDLLTASGSGLDPHISPAAANYQAARVARLRNLPLDAIQTLIAKHSTPRQFGILGEPVVNVLSLNQELDQR